MAEVSAPEPLPELDVAIDPDFEPQKRPRSCTWPLPRPESNAAKPESHDTDIIPEEEDDDEDHHATSMAMNVNGTDATSEDQSSSCSPAAEGLLSSLGQGSPLSSHSPPGQGSLVAGPGGAQQTPRKSSSRRNAWGNMSYADLITKAIESTADKRLTLSQIYDWMVRCVPYFKDKGDSNSSAGWKNSIRHNLSLHSRFIRVQNEGTGKSSWWMINPEGGKGGKAPRRRAVSMDNSNKYTKSARGRAAKKKAALQAAAASGGGEGVGGDNSPSGLSKWPGSPTSRSSEDLDACWTDFRSRTNSNASTLSGRLSPILAINAELDDVPDDEPPLSPMMLYSGGGTSSSLSPGGNPSSSARPTTAGASPNGKAADLSGAASNLNDGLTDDLMDELLDNITLALAPLNGVQLGSGGGGSGPGSPGFGFGAKPLTSPSVAAAAASSSPVSAPVPIANGGFASSVFGSSPSSSSSLLRPAPMQTIQENKQTSFSSISRFGGQTLQDLLSADGPTHNSRSDVMMTQSDPLMSQAGAAAVVSQNSRGQRGLMLRSDPMLGFGSILGVQGHQGALRVLNGGGGLHELNAHNNNNHTKQQLLSSSSLGGATTSNGCVPPSLMQIDSSLFLNGTTVGVGGDRFPSDLDLDIFNGSLECDMDLIIRNELMDPDGFDQISFDSCVGGGGGFGGAKHSSSSSTWVPG